MHELFFHLHQFQQAIPAFFLCADPASLSFPPNLHHEEALKFPYQTLSNREFEVLKRLGAGKSIKAFAVELSLSPKTISTYRSRLIGKLKLKTTADIIHYVIENHLEE